MTEDLLAPALTAATPAAHATGIPVDGSLLLLFDEPVRALAGGIIEWMTDYDYGHRMVEQIRADSPQVVVDGATVRITPAQPMDYATGYHIGFVRAFAGTDGSLWEIPHAALSFVTEAAPLTRVGTAGPDVLTGGEGRDVLLGLDGDDLFVGGPGDDLFAGGGGLDRLLVLGPQAGHALQRDGFWWTLDDLAGIGTDRLLDLERVEFDDGKLALDLDGAAGQAVRLLGAAFGSAAVHNRAWAGVALSVFDAGLSMEQAAALAVGTQAFRDGAGSPDSAAAVRFIWSNVWGGEPPAADLALLAGLVDAGAVTLARLLAIAAESEANRVAVDLVGLQHSGLHYL